MSVGHDGKRPSLLTRAAFVVATWFGSGLSPVAPGTVGTLLSLPVHFLLVPLPAPLHVAVLVALVGLGTLCAGRVAQVRRLKDPQIVVVDETAGVLLALLLVRDLGWWAFAAAVLAFRGLDIVKPWPIRRLEDLKPAGIGIMADDLAAGLVAGLAVLFAARVFA